MVKFLVGCGSDVEPMPDWDVYACDAFGRPTELIGGVMNAGRTHEEALALYLSMNPEWPGEWLHVRRSMIVPPWETVEDV